MLSRPAPVISGLNVQKLVTPVLLSVCALILSACGGGSGSASPTMATSSVASASSATTAASAVDTGLQTKAPVNDPACPIQYSANTATPLTGADPMLGQEWHLKNTGQFLGAVGEDINVEGAWTQTQGQGVRIAVVDDALEVVHSDLQANIVPGGSYNYHPAVLGSAYPLPCNTDEGHGTSVAGIIAAVANDAIGTVGVAPKAQLVGFNALSLDLTNDVADALTRDMNLNSIYNNSWGSPDDGVINPGEPEFYAAIAKGIQNGRQGKGAIYVFSGGNGGCYTVTGLGVCQHDNSNFDGYVNRLGVITVAGIDQNGRQPWYGEAGANILVSAPAGDAVAGITTTAMSNGYSSGFEGTSAAAPMTSGVLALMLSVNPNLTWRDARLVLAHSARKNDQTDPSWNKGYSPKFGFGVIDATAAVNMAKTWTSVGGSESLKSCTISAPAHAQAIPDAGSAVGGALSLAGCAITSIEFVSVTVQIDHQYTGDLQINLLSPSGTTSTLSTSRLCTSTDRSKNNCGSLNNWQFGSVRHLDETAAGSWSLSVQDMVAGQTGNFNGWTLTVYGR